MNQPPLHQLLPNHQFADVVRLTPLVSIDLIIRDPLGRILLGRRNFEPAKGYYFVPGGRILKDETIHDAFMRISRTEIGATLDVSRMNFLGVYEHFYAESRFGPKGSTTHYVVLAYEIDGIPLDHAPVADDQHTDFIWVRVPELLQRQDVHAFVKAYFVSPSPQTTTPTRKS